MPIRPTRLLHSTLSLALLSAVLIIACGSQDQSMEGPETDDPAALVWEVWEKIDLFYAGRDDLDSNALVNGGRPPDAGPDPSPSIPPSSQRWAGCGAKYSPAYRKR